jgi:hypothetical protein
VGNRDGEVQRRVRRRQKVYVKQRQTSQIYSSEFAGGVDV